MEKQYNLDAVGKEKSFLPVSFCLKVMFALKSAAVHLLVLPYWPSRVGRESPKLSLLVLPLLAYLVPQWWPVGAEEGEDSTEGMGTRGRMWSLP